MTHPAFDSQPFDPAIADSLAEQGYAVLPGFFSQGLIAALLSDLDGLMQGGGFHQAGVGRQGDHRVMEAVRNDKTLWLDGTGTAQESYLAQMDILQAGLNSTLYLGLSEFEAHYARYESGGFYKKHIDSLRGTRNRIVSSVTYLTPGWTGDDAGHLVLYDGPGDDSDREIARVLPVAGTLALFMSETIPHEVLPPNRPRSSIAGWFRCRA